ncbi:UNVERIFIED_CONTAM: hypothetical protein Sradi_7190200 [Sesamum radiatum]|uniref:Uncharacterized protein n=1 Tax=Sesamum radiatum TaxID=300843 RepID=A0AAW2IQL6_SESRA
MGRKHITGPLKGTDAAGLWDVTKLAARSTETNSNSKIQEGNYPLTSFLAYLTSIDKKYSLVSKPPRGNLLFNSNWCNSRGLCKAWLYLDSLRAARKQKRCMPKGQGQAGNDLYWKKFKPLKSLTSGNSVITWEGQRGGAKKGNSTLLCFWAPRAGRGRVIQLAARADREREDGKYALPVAAVSFSFFFRTGEEREEDALRERVRYLDLVRERRNLNCNTAPSENNTAITDSNQQSPSTPGSSHDIYIYEDHPGLNLDSERVVELQAEIGEKFREAVKSAGDERLFSKPEDYIAAIEQLHGESESIEFLQSLSDDLVKNGANGETYKEGIQMWIDLMMSSPLDQFSILH